MTNQEAIGILKDLWRWEHPNFLEKDIREALDKGIEALENQKNDIVSVEQAEDILYSSLRVTTDYSNEAIRAFIEAIKNESPKRSIAELQKEIDKLKVGKQMTLEENIRSILECNFAGYKDEIIDIATKNIMNLSDIKGDKCDNDHDCEHCDWVECPEMEEEKIKIPELTLIEGKDIPKDATLLEAAIYLRYRKPSYEHLFDDYTITLPLLVRINKEEEG